MQDVTTQKMTKLINSDLVLSLESRNLILNLWYTVMTPTSFSTYIMNVLTLNLESLIQEKEFILIKQLKQFHS